MDNQAYQEAKNIFLKYKCSHFFLAREGDYEKYKAYNVPKRLENEWIDEQRAEKIKLLETETNNDRISHLVFDIEMTIGQYCPNADPLYYLKNYITEKKTQFDSFTLILISESILRAVEEYGKNTSYDKMKLDYIREYMLDLLNELLISPITVSKDYDYMIHYDFSEENLRNRIKGKIEHWNKKKALL